MVVIGLAAAQMHSCSGFSRADEEMLDQHGGVFVPSGEGPLVHSTPVDSVRFKPEKRDLDDKEFAEVFPAIKRMDPLRLQLDGKDRLTDQSIELINQLRSLRALDVRGTGMTAAGLKRLQTKSLRTLDVSESLLTEEDLTEMRTGLPGTKIYQGKIRDRVPTTSQTK